MIHLVDSPNELQPLVAQKKNRPEMSPSAKKHISAIQGLRGIAVGAVLLFHVTPHEWKVGHLGVDLFFLISGFLMCSILSKPSASITEFYFRRIRRIVPSYLGLIGLVLGAASYGLISQLDYGGLIAETWKPLLYVANFPSLVDNNYFHQGYGVYEFFRHLWSLSAELQFYAFVPWLCYGLSKFPKYSNRIAICSAIAVFSFFAQIISNGDLQHMALYGRVWQFMFGFVAFYLREICKQKFTSKSGNEEISVQMGKNQIQMETAESKTEPTFFEQINWGIFHIPTQIVLLILLIYPIFPILQFHRLILLSVGVLIVAFPPQELSLLNVEPLVWLGDISYSVYLIHWPLIQWHFYTEAIDEAKPRVGFALIGVSIASGFVLERLYQRITPFLTNWRRLVGILLVSYLLIAAAMLYLHEKEFKFDKTEAKQILKNPKQLMKWAVALHQHKDKPFHKNQLGFMNYQLSALSYGMYDCPNKDPTAIPTRFNISAEIGFGNRDKIENIHGFTAHCVEKGNGTKNIVMIGNSHAQAEYFGFKRAFSDVYANITMLSAGACPIIDWEGEIPHRSTAHLSACINFRDKIFDLLRQWEHPIDILVFAHAYILPPNSKALKRFANESDPLLAEDFYTKKLQKFFGTAETIAKEAVFVPHYQFHTFQEAQVDVFVRRLYANQDLGIFRHSWESQRLVKPPLDQRFRYLKCHKCIQLNWEKVWCNERANVCDSVDYSRKITFFTDGNHVNALGSLTYGKFARQQYNAFLQKQKKRKSEEEREYDD